MPKTDKIVIWPIYLDGTASRNDGRRVTRRNAVKSPTLDEIDAAARMLDLDPVIEQTKAYPASWWGKRGRVLIKKIDTPKSSILREIASRIREIRSSG